MAEAILYALGTMLYELLVGEPPFVGTDKLQIMSQQAHQKPDPPSERISWGEIPANLEAIALQCLEGSGSSLPGLQCADSSFGPNTITRRWPRRGLRKRHYVFGHFDRHRSPTTGFNRGAGIRK